MTALALRLISVLAAGVAAYMWFRSAAVPFPLLSGAAIGGTSPADPFNIAVKHSGFWNERAAVVTGLSVLLSGAAEGLALLRTSR